MLAVVPAFNEQRKIQKVVSDLIPFVDEVLVIDDGSVDMTAQKAKGAGASVLIHKINRGQGAALQTGHQYALAKNFDHVLHFDGDGQFDTGQIKPALEFLKKKKVDILLGSRFLDKKSNIPFLKKNLLLPIGRVIDRLSGAVRLTDAHNGFRILTKKALQKIVITQDRMAHATQIPVLIKKNDLDYVEYPVTVEYSEYGQGLKGGLAILKDLFFDNFVR